MAVATPFQINGICTGMGGYQGKKGYVHQLYIAIAGTQNVISVNVPDDVQEADYPVGKLVSIRAIPLFFNGSITGFSLVRPATTK